MNVGVQRKECAIDKRMVGICKAWSAWLTILGNKIRTIILGPILGAFFAFECKAEMWWGTADTKAGGRVRPQGENVPEREGQFYSCFFRPVHC